MKSFSQKFVLISLLLQLCLGVPERVLVDNLQFGDIITFSCVGGVYDHYAIYIDDERRINGRTNANQNIFEMTKSPHNGCRFGTVTVSATRNNYLDTTISPPQVRDDVIDAINNLMNGNCGSWSLTNNCEHIATLVRYGEANSQCNQPGTLAAPFCKLFRKRRQRRHKLSEDLSPNESAGAA